MPLNIKKSDFVKSATKPSQYPDDIYPEFFFAGKSNAGKSSMLNKICNRRKLASGSDAAEDGDFSRFIFSMGTSF